MASTELVNFAGLSFLCEKLRLESLLIKHEKFTLEDLNRKVIKEYNNICKQIWIYRHQQEILNQLINSDINVSPENCCQLFNNLYSSNFVEAYKILNQYAAEIVQIYKVLAYAPRAVSMFLNATEKITATNYTIDELCSCVFNVIYGSCFFPEDEKNMLELLGHLINLQIVQNPDPRKILRKGNSVFSRMYKYFSESLLSTKIFLTAALHEPIMFLLSQDDKLAQHRRIIVDKLVLVVETFINAILNAMPIFPKSIIWLVDQMHTAMIERKLVSNDEAALICTDLIFTYFICSAVIHPEPLGIISDTPIRFGFLNFWYPRVCFNIGRDDCGLRRVGSCFRNFLWILFRYIARFNLMQVGQLLQSLAILPYEQRFPSYFNEILSHLDKNSMTKVMDTVLQTGSASIETIFPTQIADSKGNEVFRRTTFVASLNEINILQYYLKSPALEEINDAALLKNLKLLLKRLPEQFNEKIKFYMGLPEKEQSQQQQQPISSSTRLRNLADKVQNVASKGHQKLIQTTSVSNFRNSDQQNLTNSLSVNVLVNENENNNNCNLISNNNNNQQQKQQNQNGVNSTTNENFNRDVLLFEIPDSYEPIGTTSEEEVLKLNFRLESKKCNGQKKTRFLAATDSVVSDRTNTDVISDDDEEEEDDQEVGEVEGVDDTSSSSSNGNAEEAEEDVAVLPDNFSDVVPISANVSRRGSPSLSGSKLSGRETPFSNHAEQNNVIENSSSTIPTFSNTLPQQEANNNRRTLPYLPVTVRKQNSEGLEEKFGKFVLPQIDSTRNRDETISLVSDNWSTDVVASDNEAAMIELRNAVDASSSSISSIQQPQNSFLQQNNFAVQQQQNNVLPINKLQQQISSLNSSKQLNNLTNFSSNLASSSNIVTAPIAVLNPVNALTNLVLSSTADNIPNNINNIDEEEDKLPYFDQNNITTCRAFLDAKRKLRLVLSNTTTLPKSLDLINYKEASNTNDKQHQQKEAINGNDVGDSSTRKIADAEVLALQQMLHLFLADSINSRDRKQAAQIREVLRCLSIFDNKGIFLLLKKLKREQRQRLCYTLYLQQSQSTLLQFKYCLEKMNNRFVRNLELTSECLVEMLVRFHLQKEDLRQFVQNFQNLHVQDEKVELVSSTLRILCDQLLTDPIWHFATVENLDYARKCMERSLMAQIYVYALFPNSDADYYRDEVLSKSIRQLSSLLSVDHPDLAIPKCLHAECPWSSAQAELNIINAYKSPRDKMNCISRCCETIENLIVLSAGRVTSSADDILPILVFVIIKANPHALLSNLQFIDSFYASRMQGSEAYWWTQFNSAVEFLKTLLNKLCNK
ncbi:unnamed protein product [Meloidogyne enterolobii]|uniref:Uncharacterized protein n=1 Tax=Meloidogyne enterolobii TaxID=390850 RepID=A0ACB1A767_MELEN